MNEIRIGLLGFGNVGSGTYDTLEMNKEKIKKETGLTFTVKKALVRDPSKPRRTDAPAEIFTKDPSDVIGNPDIDIVCEVLGGIEPSTQYMLDAMNAGQHVVSANKAALANSFEKLADAAKKNNVQLRIEASVGGGIPVLSAITSVLGANDFSHVMGICNGTTNYILTKMTDEGLEYADVLKDAQEKGFAEADPTADVEGLDVANKLSILIALCFGEYVHPSKIPTEGITGITKDMIEDARSRHCRIKLIGEAEKDENGRLSYSVKPKEIPDSHPLAGVSNEFNAIFLTGNAVDDLMFYGKGAGPLPTGSACAGDILEIGKMMKLLDENK
ncbi:MAG: homoserine dehydrogenase [Anaerovoracaceae bacterium]|nr:homoserine dehydrogenase [Anaerovoracaceae bacterium]